MYTYKIYLILYINTHVVWLVSVHSEHFNGKLGKLEAQPVRARISSSLFLEVARETAMST